MSRRPKQLSVRVELRIDEGQAKKLRDFSLIVHRSQADIIRHFIDQMTLELLPPKWLTELEDARARQEGQP